MDTRYHDHHEEEKRVDYVTAEELVENIDKTLNEFKVLSAEIYSIKSSNNNEVEFKTKNGQAIRVFLKLTHLLSELRDYGSLEDTLYEYEIMKDKEFKEYEETVKTKEKEYEEIEKRQGSLRYKITNNYVFKSVGTVLGLGILGGVVGGPVGGIISMAAGAGTLIGGATVGGAIGVGVGGAVGLSTLTGKKAVDGVKKIKAEKKEKKQIEIDITNDIDELTSPPLIFMSQQSQDDDDEEEEENEGEGELEKIMDDDDDVDDDTVPLLNSKSTIKIEKNENPLNNNETKTSSFFGSFFSWGKKEEDLKKETEKEKIEEEETKGGEGIFTLESKEEDDGEDEKLKKRE